MRVLKQGVQVWQKLISCPDGFPEQKENLKVCKPRDLLFYSFKAWAEQVSETIHAWTLNFLSMTSILLGSRPCKNESSDIDKFIFHGHAQCWQNPTFRGVLLYPARCRFSIDPRFSSGWVQVCMPPEKGVECAYLVPSGLQLCAWITEKAPNISAYIISWACQDVLEQSWKSRDCSSLLPLNWTEPNPFLPVACKRDVFGYIPRYPAVISIHASGTLYESNLMQTHPVRFRN